MDATVKKEIIARKDGAIGRMILSNEARRNALTLDMWQGMADAVRSFERDSEIRVIVVSGAGDQAFSAGADISEFEEKRGTEAAVRHYEEVVERAIHALTLTPKPTLAMIRGFCVGGGLEIAISCDLRLAAEDARFGIPAARLGLGYAYPGVAQLADIVGPAAVKEIFFTGGQFSAAEALRMGLVNRVLPTAELESGVADLAATIAGNAPMTVAAVKRCVAEYVRDPEDRDLVGCQALVDACFGSEDYKEGRRAFMEKRPPVFQGR